MAFPTSATVGVVPSPCGIEKDVVVPSPLKVATPPFIAVGALLSSSSRASIILLYSSGVRIYGRGS